MSVLRFSLALMMLLAFASQAFVSLTFAEVSEYKASLALATAEEAIVSAYQEALKAEEAGANVSELYVQLNKAGESLARAYIEYKSGDFEKATNFANSSRSIGVEVQNAAVGLKDSALSQGMQRILFTMIASVVGVASIALGSLWLWHLLKKRYGSS